MNEKAKSRAPRAENDGASDFRRALHALSRAVLLLLLTAAAIVMMTIFFKVNTISVEGAEKYSVEEITNALDISKGDNLYLWNKMKTISICGGGCRIWRLCAHSRASAEYAG